MATDPRLRAALESVDREATEAITSLRSMADSLRREQAAFRARARDRDQARTRAARAGELGPEMQHVQERVDRNLTTWSDVVEGRDEHPTAARVRDTMRRRVAVLGREVRSDPEVAELDAEVRRTAARVAARRNASG